MDNNQNSQTECYKEMYLTLFREVSEVIYKLWKIQLKTEEMFLSEGESEEDFL